MLKSLKAVDYTNAKFGIPTVTDIFHELDKPGRDPRPEFKTAVFKEGIETLQDLRPEMILEGVITNVANLVHLLILVFTKMDWCIYQCWRIICERSASGGEGGSNCKSQSTEVDIPRKRIQLSMRLTGGGDGYARCC